MTGVDFLFPPITHSPAFFESFMANRFVFGFLEATLDQNFINIVKADFVKCIYLCDSYLYISKNEKNKQTKNEIWPKYAPHTKFY